MAGERLGYVREGREMETGGGIGVVRDLRPDLWGYLSKTFGDLAAFKWVTAIAVGISDYIFPHEVGRDAALAAGILILIDTMTGVAASFVTGKHISSSRFSRVLVKFLGYGSVVAVSAIATKNLPGFSEFQQASVTAIVTLVITTESISILENVARMGVNLPPGLQEWLNKRIGTGEPQEPKP